MSNTLRNEFSFHDHGYRLGKFSTSLQFDVLICNNSYQDGQKHYAMMVLLFGVIMTGF